MKLHATFVDEFYLFIVMMGEHYFNIFVFVLKDRNYNYVAYGLICDAPRTDVFNLCCDLRFSIPFMLLI